MKLQGFSYEKVQIKTDLFFLLKQKDKIKMLHSLLQDFKVALSKESLKLSSKVIKINFSEKYLDLNIATYLAKRDTAFRDIYSKMFPVVSSSLNQNNFSQDAPNDWTIYGIICD